MAQNYVHEVTREGKVTKRVVCKDGPVLITFALTHSGKIAPIARVNQEARAYYPGATSVSQQAYAQMVRQANAILKGAK